MYCMCVSQDIHLFKADLCWPYGHGADKLDVMLCSNP